MMKNSLENFSSKYLVDTSTQLSRKHKHLIFNRLEKLAKITKKRPKALFLAKNEKKRRFFVSYFNNTEIASYYYKVIQPINLVFQIKLSNFA